MTARPEVVRAALGNELAPPSRDGEPVFAEPWEGRAYGLALETVERLGLGWEQFRSRLIAAIAEAPGRAYYESWVVALERLVVDHGSLAPSTLLAERAEAASYAYTDDLGDIDVIPFAAVRLLERGDGRLVPASAAQVELYHRHDAEDRPTGWGLRSFDASGDPLSDEAMGEDDWAALLARLLADSPPHG